MENMNSTKRSLIQQAQRIHGKGRKIYHCGKCDYTSYERQSVRDHRKVTHEHGTLSQFKCDLCEYSSREERYLIQHMRASHVTKPAIEQGKVRPKPLKCGQCQFSCTQNWTLKKHFVTMHQNSGKVKEKHKCELCDYSSEERSDLTLHVSASHGTITDYKCPLCYYASSEKEALDMHLRVVHSHCTDAAKSRLTNHDFHKANNPAMRYSNVDNDKNIKNSRVGPDGIEDKDIAYDGDQNSSAILEMNTSCISTGAQENSIIYNCDLCKYSSHRKEDLYLHKRAFHMGDPLKPHKCVQCESFFSRKHNLNRHIERVHKKTPHNKIYKCDHCDYNSDRAYNVTSHTKAVHDMIKEIKCDNSEHVESRDRHSNEDHTELTGETNLQFPINSCVGDTHPMPENTTRLHDAHAFDQTNQIKFSDLAKYLPLSEEVLNGVDSEDNPMGYDLSNYLPLSEKELNEVGSKVNKIEYDLSKYLPLSENVLNEVDSKDNPIVYDLSKYLPLSEKVFNEMDSTENIIGYEPKESGGLVHHREETFTKEQIYTALEFDDQSAKMVRKKAAICIAHCGGISLSDLTSITFQSVTVGEQGVWMKCPLQIGGGFLVPFSQAHSGPCMASHVVAYLDGLQKTGKTLRPHDPLFSNARHDELCALGQEVASRLGLDHPELYAGHCFNSTFKPIVVTNVM